MAKIKVTIVSAREKISSSKIRIHGVLVYRLPDVKCGAQSQTQKAGVCVLSWQVH